MSVVAYLEATFLEFPIPEFSGRNFSENDSVFNIKSAYIGKQHTRIEFLDDKAEKQ